MATLLLAAAGSALAGGFAGSLGIAAATAAQIGGAVGGIAGAAIDEAVLRALAPTGGKVSEVPIGSATEGVPIKKLWGRMRLGGNVVWCTRFNQQGVVKVPGSGKGGVFDTSSKAANYVLSFAVALCEGGEKVILERIWADGNELDQSKYNIRFYNGSEAQEPDSLIQSTEGPDSVPAYRGICYIVFDTMSLYDFGNRMPQITAEIVRYTDNADADDLTNCLHSVALLPGSGEFTYGTTAYTRTDSEGVSKSENVHGKRGITDLQVSLNQLQGGHYTAEVGGTGSGWVQSANDLGCLSAPSAVSLIVTWFGTDLRASVCQVVPKVESQAKSVTPADWSVAGYSRGTAQAVSQVAPSLLNPGSPFTGTVPAFGGTPSDDTVLQAIAELKRRGLRIVFYPFIMMDIPPGNGLVDPYGATQQAAFPWRGRVTCHPAPGQAGSVDKTAAATTQINAFFSSYGAMVAHYASLCVAAGGVDAFIIGSELVGLTSVRSSPGDGHYPAVDALKSLAASVRGIVGASCKLGYAADWSEYHSHRSGDGSNDVIFNLDPLWSDANIDFIGIDNYLPLSDWRYTDPNADANPATGPLAPHDKTYLRGNVEGGEYFDWYYATAADRVAQNRSTIVDTAHGQNWVFRQKDIRNWWLNGHNSRPGGVQNATATAWTAQSKPIWFTELGCPAVDLGSNQPNVFYDPKSSESTFPYFSRGAKDDAIQRAYLETVLCYWRDQAPTSSLYGGPMIDPVNIFAWAWDARPYPDFPAMSTVWSDYGNWEYGHWLTGRLTYVPLKWIIAELATLVGMDPANDIDTSRLLGATTLVPGYAVDALTSPRDALGTLMNAFQFDVVESAGVLCFCAKALTVMTALSSDQFVLDGDGDVGFNVTRAQETDLPGTVKLTFFDVYRNYATASVEGRKNIGNSQNSTTISTTAVLDQGQAKGLADSILQQIWSARESGDVKLPLSLVSLDPGDGVLISIVGTDASSMLLSARIKEIDTTTYRTAKFIGFNPSLASAPIFPPSPKQTSAADVYGPSIVEFVEMPVLTGEESQSWAPRIAAYQSPWPVAGVNVFRFNGAGYDFVTTVESPAVLGELASPLYAGPVDRWDRGNVAHVQFYGAASLATVADDVVLSGANAVAVENPASGDWEIVQFAHATLVAANKYALSRLLRGQLGTEGAMGQPVPAGARVIFLDATRFAVLSMNVDQRGIVQALSYGPAAYDQADPSYRSTSLTVRGEGLRPYSVNQVEALLDSSSGNVTFSWLRRTRFGGDNFDLANVPLNEDEEAYDVEVLNGGGAVVRSVSVLAPAWTYTAAQQATDFGSPQPHHTLNVYQDSVLYGRGQVRTAVVQLSSSV